MEKNQREQIQTVNFPTMATVTSIRPLSVKKSAQPFAAAVSVSLLHAARSRAAACAPSMVMALPFWIAMATEWSTSVAASSRDQRDRCSEAAPLIRSSTARASGPSPPHVSMTKGRSSASWRLAMAAYFVRFLPSMALAVASEFAGF